MNTHKQVQHLEALTGQSFQAYTIQELEAKYGKMGALVIWQMRNQSK